MSNQEIVYCLAYSGVVEKISRNIRVTPDYYDDFVQEIYLMLLEYDNKKLDDIFQKNQIKYFTSRIAINNWCSSTSPFYCKYKRPLTHRDANADRLTLSDKI